MSFENDITTIKQIMEDKPLFKKASDVNLAKREEVRQEAPVLSVDSSAYKLSGKMWDSVEVLRSRMIELQREKNGGNDECTCDVDRLEEEGIDEFTSVPGDEMTLYNFCLRCGGMRETF